MPQEGCRVVDRTLVAFRDFVTQMERWDVSSATKFMASVRTEERRGSPRFSATAFEMHCYVHCVSSCWMRNPSHKGWVRKWRSLYVEEVWEGQMGFFWLPRFSVQEVLWEAENLSLAPGNGIGSNRNGAYASGLWAQLMWNLRQVICISNPHSIRR